MSQWIEVSIQTTHEAADLVAEIMCAAGANNGVVIEDPVLINTLRNSGTWELCDIPEQENTEVVTITAYYPEDEELQPRLTQIDEDLTNLETRIGKCRFGNTRFRTVSEQDWANEWKQYFHVTHIGRTLVIKPTWETIPEEHKDKLLILEFLFDVLLDHVGIRPYKFDVQHCLFSSEFGFSTPRGPSGGNSAPALLQRRRDRPQVVLVVEFNDQPAPAVLPFHLHLAGEALGEGELHLGKKALVPGVLRLGSGFLLLLPLGERLDLPHREALFDRVRRRLPDELLLPQ